MPDDKKPKKQKILEIMPAHRERERKYIFIPADEDKRNGPAAVAHYRKRKLLDLYEYVRANTDEFVTADHPDLSPYLPPGLKETFDMPAERTSPRERIYFADAKLRCHRKQVEFRQELGKDYGVKQTVKRGGSATKEDPTLDRREFPAKLSAQGVNLDAVDGKDDREWLKKHFNEAALKPAFRMVSQRLRTSYHPDGNQDVEIELACDVILTGETFFGRVWHDPKLELEIKRPDNLTEAQAKKILDTEERRLRKFGLIRQLESNGALGCEMLREDLADPVKRKRFEALKPGDVWWTARNRPKFGLG
jgi:hypothetical protein